MEVFALVIGNKNYQNGQPCPTAENDANEIAAEFHKLGYKVELHIDCAVKDIPEILDSYEKNLKTHDASIIYYAGHGFEVQGENFLPAVDCPIDANNSPHFFRHNSIVLNEIMDICKKVPKKMNILILDACRRKSSERGNAFDCFAPIMAPQGTLIAFSTSPGGGAYDQHEDENHSPFTKALLQFLQVPRLTAESLFKKVRQAVFSWTEKREHGPQIPWEHSSLITDFYFNPGLSNKVTLPYVSWVVKDSQYAEPGPFGEIINDLKNYNWNIQNPALEKVLSIPANQLDSNQKFILGRNLYQTSNIVRNSIAFFDRLTQNLYPYNEHGENHILNGILFEMYFDPNGEFRNGKYKLHQKEKVLALRKDERFSKSFDFIINLLKAQEDIPIYIPSPEDIAIDVIVNANKETRLIDPWSGEDGPTDDFQTLNSIIVYDRDILQNITILGHQEDGVDFKRRISDFLCAPCELITIHSNIDLNWIIYPSYIDI